MKNYLKLLSIVIIPIVFFGCVTDSKQLILDNVQQVEVRSYQTKSYEQSKLTVSRAVISALQDLGFIADKVDMDTGTVTATKLGNNAAMKITVIVREIGNLTRVRTNAQFSSINQTPKAVDDPKTYEAFFVALDRAIFLEKEGL
ncbi:MAG: hypothetical protein LBF71_01875 [Campylobacteraceae bacterium]|jgi:hypothetical protein|nr:hypothetical protein [Campylobacteraceae bacterium]